MHTFLKNDNKIEGSMSKCISVTAYKEAFIGWITTPICPHCGSGEQTAEHLLPSRPKWAAECQHYFETVSTSKICFKTT